MTTQLKIEGMSCGHCVAAVQKALTSVDGVQQVSVSLENGSATVEHESTTPIQKLTEAVTEEGYQAKEA